MSNDLRNMMTLQDCKLLKQLIIDNPELPLLILCDRELDHTYGDYVSLPSGHPEIQELTVYEDAWIAKDDYIEALRLSMEEDIHYDGMSDEAFYMELNELVDETEFVKAIVIYVSD